MTWFKENWFKLILTILGLIITVSIIFYFVIQPLHKQKIKISATQSKSSSEVKLVEKFKKYYDYLEIGLCSEAYNMHTSGSKGKLSYEDFKIHCEITQKWERDFKVDKIVYSGDYKADIRFTYNELGIDNNAEFRDCLDSQYSSWESCASNASKKLKGKKEDIGTWLYENGEWLRDF